MKALRVLCSRLCLIILSSLFPHSTSLFYFTFSQYVAVSSCYSDYRCAQGQISRTFWVGAGTRVLSTAHLQIGFCLKNQTSQVTFISPSPYGHPCLPFFSFFICLFLWCFPLDALHICGPYCSVVSALKKLVFNFVFHSQNICHFCDIYGGGAKSWEHPAAHRQLPGVLRHGRGHGRTGVWHSAFLRVSPW